MFRWQWVLAVALLLASLLPASSLAYPIRVNFTVLGDSADPVNAGLIGTGDFMFDSSVILLGLRPQAVGAISFSWEGRNWTQADADLITVAFAPDSTLTGWALGGDAATAGNLSSTEQDFIVGLSGGTLYFYYTTASGTRYFAGTVVTWDTATLPSIIGAWGDGVVQLTLDSFGRVYSYSQVGCPGQLGTVAIIGNLFNGPPPSRVVSMASYTNIVFATLENGDIWQLCSGANAGTLVGNIFNAPGIAAVSYSPPRPLNTLASSRPNPFNPATKIPYTLRIPGRVAIRVYDASGRLVRTIEDEQKPSGAHTATWTGETDNGTKAASGTYFLRITYPDGTSAEQKLTVLK